MHVRIVRQVLAHRVANSYELPLDDALFGFSSSRQQHIAIARREPGFCVRYRV